MQTGIPRTSGGSVGRNRSGVLELAVLGLLHGTPMHGYELRKRLYTVLGAFRALSYGSLYPCLHELLAAGLIAEEHEEAGAAPDEAPEDAHAVRSERAVVATAAARTNGLGVIGRDPR